MEAQQCSCRTIIAASLLNAQKRKDSEITSMEECLMKTIKLAETAKQLA